MHPPDRFTSRFWRDIGTIPNCGALRRRLADHYGITCPMPVVTTVPPGTLSAMIKSAQDEITQALAFGSPGMIAIPRTEPGLVAAVHLGAVPRIASAWKAELAPLGATIKLSGVFCHQSPMVTYIDSKGSVRRCELADLLVVVDSQMPWFMGRTAVLIQAKMAAAYGTVSPTGVSSLTQLELYQRWPAFDFEQAAYRMTAVDIKHGTDHALSGTFGVIDRHWRRSGAPRWSQHPASPTPCKTKGFPELGKFLARMCVGVPGFGRDANPTAGTAWSNMIEKLLRENQVKMFQHKATLGGVFANRSVKAFMQMQSVPPFFSITSGGAAPPDGEFEVLEDGPTGISMLHIEVGG